MPFATRALEPTYLITVEDGEHAMSQTAGSEVESVLPAIGKVCQATKAAFQPYVTEIFNKLIAADTLPLHHVAGTNARA